jgi:Pyridine nucleotide-disulphide oxidoreductase
VRRMAVIGAGPIGLEAALEARRRGHEVTVYEADRVGAHFRRYGDVQLFTPFGMNATRLGGERVVEEGAALPPADALLTAREFLERYLEPLARLPELRGAIREGTRVGQIAREGLRKPGGIAAVGDPARSGRPFLLRVEDAGGARFERADVLIDASGVYGSPNATGPGGLPAVGEETLGERVERHLPSIRGEARARYTGKRLLLVGDGYSAATALVDLAVLVREDREAPRVHWIHRDTVGDVWPPDPADALPARRSLADRANAAAREEGWLQRHSGATVLAYETRGAGPVRATLREGDGTGRAVEVDRVLALVGYRPDVQLCREVHMHLCYASEGPMALARALLAARAADAPAAADCLSQRSHGPDSLKSPEPDFFVIGAKSYGRNPNFLLSIGHEQIRDVMDLVGAPAPAEHAG